MRYTSVFHLLIMVSAAVFISCTCADTRIQNIVQQLSLESAQQQEETRDMYLRQRLHALLQEFQGEIARESISLEVILRFWHDKSCDYSLWLRLAHDILDFSLQHDPFNPQRLCERFSEEPYKTMFLSHAPDSGICAGLEVKGDYIGMAEITLYAQRSHCCGCTKKWYPDDPSVVCICKTFDSKKDAEPLFADEDIWQKVALDFIVSMIESLERAQLHLDLKMQFIAAFDQKIKDLLALANKNSGIHGIFEVRISDNKAHFSYCFDVQDNDHKDWHTRIKL